ncbi:MAG: NAD(P)/FAD-dependent oxidoreductase [Uliginosibacterium sp.]|jgi:thioredoxin reductase|nr:NAD(P)/FAD-dependent oxidoreductase [Uliginosibacterium sp.]
MMQTPGVLIVGAGPAGLSCALWLKKLGLAPIILDRAALAGGLMNRNTLPNDWVLGQVGETGPSLAARFVRHVASLQVPISLGIDGLSMVRGDLGFQAQWQERGESRRLACAAVVLATGTRVRGAESLSGVPGLEEISPHVRYGPTAFDDIPEAARGLTLIVGGGDNAAENAHMLLAAGGEVVVVARSEFRAQTAMMARIVANPRARCVSKGRILALRPLPTGDFAATLFSEACPSLVVKAQRLHVLTGYEPNSDFSTGFDVDTWRALRRDEQAYLCTDAAGRCGVPGVYAAGDVCNPVFPSVVSAMAHGAMVAKAIERDLRLASSQS